MIRLGAQIALIISSLLAAFLLVSNAGTLTAISTDVEDVQAGAPPASIADKAIPPVVHPQLSKFRETVTRPIFFESRRFPTVSVEPPRPPPTPPPPPASTISADQFHLLGIVSHDGQKRALIEGPSVLLDWYAEGAKLRDWTLSRIEDNSILLSSDIKNAELLLFRPAEQN